MFGKWTIGAGRYSELVRRFSSEVGNLEWAASQDWMCEPAMLAKTGLSVQSHQDLTIQNFLDLKSTAPDLPFVPVLQGWSVDDYRRHVDLYLDRGIDLFSLPIVGIGSVCRRAHLQEISTLVSEFHGIGLRLHGFGVKIGGLRTMSETLVSSDSMAWSLAGRRNAPLPDCIGHKNCANCLPYALSWREKVLAIPGVI